MPYQQTPRETIPNSGWNPSNLAGLRGSDSSILRSTFTSLKDYLRRENSGLILTNTFNAPGNNRALVCDNIFNSNYDNYRIVGKLRSTINANNLFFQFLDSSGGTIATNYVTTAYGLDYQAAGTTFNVLNSTLVAYVGWLPNSSSRYLVFTIDIFGPAIAGDHTGWTITHTGLSSSVAWLGGISPGSRSVAAAERGLRFDNGGAGNLSGKVQVYGYKQ